MRKGGNYCLLRRLQSFGTPVFTILRLLPGRLHGMSGQSNNFKLFPRFALPFFCLFAKDPEGGGRPTT